MISEPARETAPAGAIASQPLFGQAFLRKMRDFGRELPVSDEIGRILRDSGR